MSTTKLGIVAIIGLVAMANVASVAYGQEEQKEQELETQKLSQLLTELSAYGYTEFADLTFDGSIVEFRSNGTIHLAEDTAGELVSSYGFNMTEFAPAPALEEDSIIIVQVREVGV